MTKFSLLTTGFVFGLVVVLALVLANRVEGKEIA